MRWADSGSSKIFANHPNTQSRSDHAAHNQKSTQYLIAAVESDVNAAKGQHEAKQTQKGTFKESDKAEIFRCFHGLDQ
jgi:hypothetical protein